MKDFIVNMLDLLISVNIKESRKNSLFLLETYYTKKIKLNKAGVYKGGSIERGLLSNDCKIDNIDVSFVQTLLKKYCLQVSANIFFIDAANFGLFTSELRHKDILFIDTLDNKLLVVKNISDSANGCNIKKRYDIGADVLLYFGDNTVQIQRNYSSCGENSNITQLMPIPHLCYNDENQNYVLFFEYDTEKLHYSDKKVAIRHDKNIFIRNFYCEKMTVETLQKMQFTKLAMGRFIYSGIFDKTKLSEELRKCNIRVDCEDEYAVYADIDISRVDSNWFEIDLSCNISGEITRLASLIDLSSNSREYLVNGKKVIIPSSFLQSSEHWIYEHDKIKINRCYIFDILRMAGTNGKNIKKIFDPASVDLSLPQSTLSMAFAYQLEGIRWLKFLFLNGFGGCLADDMGLGKTFQLISFLEDTDVKKKIKKILIIVPKSLITNWQKEFEKYSSNYRVGVYHGGGRCLGDINSADVVITTYNTAFADIDFLENIDFSIAVFDEIQISKNYKSVTSNAMKRINAGVKFGLSGTPMENNISELWNIIDILLPGIFASHESFLRRYKDKNKDELRAILSPFILRRKKENVLDDFPMKHEHVIYCDMGTEQKKLYASISLAVKNAILSLKVFASPVILKGLNSLRQCCCHTLLLKSSINIDGISASCKLDTLKIIVKNLYKNNHKILIFSSYTSMLKLIEEALNEYSHALFYLDGKTENRNEVVECFEKSPEGIFLISIKAGGLGLNLTSAHDVIIFDPWWNPFVEQQAIDRIYRIGQKNTVNVYRLVAANTLEEKILSMQNNKKADFDEIIDSISCNKKINIETLIQLL